MLGTLMPPPRRRPPAAGGVTLVELMVTLAIVAVLIAVALPSMRDFVARKRLEGMAQEVVTDLRMIKAHQIQNRPNMGTAIGISSNESKTCYMLFVRGNNVFNCDCGLPADQACGEPGPGSPSLIRQVDIPRSSGIEIAASRAVLAFSSYNGMPASANTIRITLTSSTAGQLVVSTNPTGLPSLCSMSGSFGSIRPCDP